ncbi:MAG: RNA methyltransferase [Myxococcota bacterium]
MTDITSVNNPRVKDVVRLQRSSADRREAGLFCIERTRELTRALDAGLTVTEVYATRDDDEAVRRAVREGARLASVNEAVLHKMSYQENPQGFVAVVRARTRPLSALPAERGLFLVCSGLEKPGNVGAILRSADAAGASGVIIDDEKFDLFNPNCIRSSTGAVFSLPISCASRLDVMAWLQDHGVRVVAATPEASVRYTDADLTGAVALVVGAEAEGLDEAWRKSASTRVAIPMRGVADSLNVSVTAALLLFEAVRQRERAGR